MRIKYETLLPLYFLIWRHWREKRWRRFKELIDPAVTDRVLDIGGSAGDWKGRGDLVGSVDLLNLAVQPVSQDAGSPVLTSIKGDGCKLDYPDQSFDIVYSNSVIEHVGDWNAQQAFAREARRVGGRLWVQTPAYSCPVEPHYLGLFIHWFPAKWHVRIARWTSVVGLSGAADLESIAKSTRLLGKREFQMLFPDCEIWTERLFFVFPKSYIALRRNDS